MGMNLKWMVIIPVVVLVLLIGAVFAVIFMRKKDE